VPVAVNMHSKAKLNLWQERNRFSLKTEIYLPVKQRTHGKAVEWYSRRIVPCMEMGPRTNIIQC
jgi:hypothetical protein